MSFNRMVPPDPIKALCAYLRAEVGHLVIPTPGGLKRIPANIPAIFRPDLPQGFDQIMPAACIVVRPMGGYKQYGKTQFYIGDPTADIVCYGTNSQQATEIARAVVVVLKQLVSQEWENTLLYSAQVAAGPTPLPDAQTLWPACWLSCQLVHGELPLAVGGG